MLLCFKDKKGDVQSEQMSTFYRNGKSSKEFKSNSYYDGIPHLRELIQHPLSFALRPSFGNDYSSNLARNSKTLRLLIHLFH